MPVMKLTDHFITTGLTCPPDKPRIEYCDADLPGLYVEVRHTSPGEGTYYLRYKNEENKTAHQKIGRTTEMSLTEARKRAKLQKAEIALGKDPRAEERKKKAAMTYADLMELYYLPFVKDRKRSWKRDDELYRLRVKSAFGGKRLSEITRQQVQLFHSSILNEGLSPATADHHLKLLRHSLNLAIEWEMLEKNPAARVKLFNISNSVEHYLNPEELERLVTVLQANDPPNGCQVAMFLLSTGARLSEALQASWDQIDRTSRIWRVPASNSKSKKIRSIPLNDSALDVLDQLGTEGNHKYLFVNKLTNERLTSINRVWSRLRIKAGLPHLRLHDLRHQYASILVNSGRSLYEVQKILGHSDAKVTERYSHLSLQTLQDAANSASLAIRGASRRADVVDSSESQAI